MSLVGGLVPYRSRQHNWPADLDSRKREMTDYRGACVEDLQVSRLAYRVAPQALPARTSGGLPTWAEGRDEWGGH